MQLNVVVDVVIGLMVLFWIVATTASFIVEAFSSFFNLRGKALEMFVREMLWGSEVGATMRKSLTWFPRRAGTERADARGAGLQVAGLDAEHAKLDIADHPLIRRLAKPAEMVGGIDTPPSYIPSHLFAKALLDRLRQVYGALLGLYELAEAARRAFPTSAESPASVWKLSALPSGMATVLLGTGPTPGFNEVGRVAAQLPAASPLRPVLQLLADRLRQEHTEGLVVEITSLWPDFQEALERRPLSLSDLQALAGSGRLPAPLAAVFKPLLDGANHDLEAFRVAVAAWYDSVMDRASGWFRRYAQWLLGFTAFGLAVILNLDAIYIGERLVADREAREAVVRLGQTIVAQGDQASSLPQRYLFRERFKDGTWVTGLQAGHDRLAKADALARQFQPLLLARGAYAEPMLALQTAALQMLRRCGNPSGGKCEADQWEQHWKEQAATRTALVAALCRVALSEPKVARADREWAIRSTDQELVTGDKAPAGSRGCSDQKLLIPESAKNVLDVTTAAWSSKPAVTWNARLAGAAWEVRRLAAVPQEAAAGGDAIEKLVASINAALDETREELKASEDALARMPAVGSISNALTRWTESKSFYWAVFLSVVGWVVTAFMASLGAPLWFDLLNKLINRRMAGPKPGPAQASEG